MVPNGEAQGWSKGLDALWGWSKVQLSPFKSFVCLLFYFFIITFMYIFLLLTCRYVYCV